MNTACPHCHAPVPTLQPGHVGGRFCPNCGKLMDPAAAQTRTVAMQPNQTGQPPLDVQTIIQRTQQAFGTGPMAPATRIAATTRPDQREQTVFIIDVSGSMDERYDARWTKLDAAKRANATMVVEKQQIDPLDEIGIVTFHRKAKTLLPLSPIQTHKRQILTALQGLRADGGTDINAGLTQAQKLFSFFRSRVVRRFVLLTDGQGGHPLRTADKLKKRGVIIDVIGVGPDPSRVDEDLLKQVASVVEGECRYRFIKDQQTLVAHYTQLAAKTATA